MFPVTQPLLSSELERQTKAVDQGAVEVCRFRGQVEELQTQLRAQAVKQNQHQEARAQLEGGSAK